MLKNSYYLFVMLVLTSVVKANTYVRPIDHKIGELNNIKVLTEVEAMILNNIFSKIVTLDKHSEVVGDIASSWNVEEMGKVFRFKIKNGIFFHDGSKLKLEDIKSSILKLKEKNGDTYFAFNYIKEIKLNNKKNEISFFLKYSNPDFLTYLADESSIITKKNESSKVLNGTGPFVFQSKSDEQMIVTKNEKYFSRKPNVKKILFKYYKAKNKVIEDYENGKVDDLFHFYVNESERRKLETKCNWYFDLLSTHRFLVVNRNKKVLKNNNVRKCLFSIFEEDKLRQKIGKGQPVLRSLVSKGVFGDHLVPKFKSEKCTDESLNALREIKKPLNVISTNPHSNSKAIVDTLKRFNVESRLQKFERFKDYYSSSKSNSTDIYLIRYTPRTPNIVFYSTLFFTPNPIISTGVENKIKIKNIIKSLSSIYDKKQRAILSSELFKILNAEHVIYPLHQFEFMGCYNKKWKGVDFPSGNYFMQDFTRLRLVDAE